MALQEMLQNLGGFQSLAANAQRMQQVEQQQMQTKEASDFLRKFYQSQQEGKPDYNSLNEAILRSPELSQNVLNGIGLQDKQQQQRAANDLTSLYQSLGNEQQFGVASAKLVNDYMAAGKSPDAILSVVEAYRTGGANAAAQALKPAAAAFVNQGFIKPELVGFGGGAEPMTAYQQASTDLRKQELEFNRAQKATELQLKTLEAAMRKEDNDLKKQDLQLKIDAQKQKMADLEKQKEVAKNEKEADLNQAYFGIDNMLNTIERVKQSPKLDSVVGTIQGRMDAYVDDEAAATIRLIEGLGSQAFMAMIPSLKGMGALSNAEGDKLAASLQNLSRVTSEKAFRETLGEVERLMNKSRSFISKRYGKPESKPDVPAAQRNEQDIMAEYGL